MQLDRISQEQSIIEKLTLSPLFAGLDESGLQSISKVFQIQAWGKGSRLFPEINTLKHFHYVASGKLKLFHVNPVNGKEFTVFILSEGDVFDVLTLLDGQKHEIEAEVLEPIEVFVAEIDKVRDWIKTNPVFNERLLPYLAHRMRRIEQKAVDVAILDTSTRLAKLIYQNLEDSSHDLKLINNLSHHDLASLIGTTRAVLNRHLQDLKQADVIEVSRKKIHVKNLNLLKERFEALV